MVSAERGEGEKREKRTRAVSNAAELTRRSSVVSSMACIFLSIANVGVSSQLPHLLLTETRESDAREK